MNWLIHKYANLQTFNLFKSFLCTFTDVALVSPNITGTAGTFSANRTELNVNTPSVVVDKGSLPEALIFVRFPKGDLIF